MATKPGKLDFLCIEKIGQRPDTKHFRCLLYFLHLWDGLCI